MIKKIGILTGGGDCPGLNAVIRAVVRVATDKYGWEVIGFKDGYRGMVLNDYMPLTSASVSGILDKGGTILGTSNRDNPFHFRVDTPEGVKYQDLSDLAIDNLRTDGVDAMVFVGGDGTMTAANIFSSRGVKAVGVPKTIDNDLMLTDFTFGFNTAVDTATEAIDRLHSTAESHHRLMVVEVMGRYAGWIALTAGMAGGADIILLPEIPYDLNKVAEAIRRRMAQGKHFSIIVVAEGAKSIGGDVVAKSTTADRPDPIRLGGVGERIAAQLAELTGIETRVSVLGHLQRGGRTIPYDRILATRFGAAAAEAIAQGDFGRMMALNGNKIVSYPLSEIAGKQKLVPLDNDLIFIGRSIGVCFGD